MATGIELPLKSQHGRLKLLSGDEYIQQLVMTALGEGDSDNPFQDVGLGSSMIFGLNDVVTEGEIRRRVTMVFASLERDQLAKLHTLTFSQEGAEKTMYLDYVNLETGERTELEVPLPSGGS